MAQVWHSRNEPEEAMSLSPNWKQIVLA